MFNNPYTYNPQASLDRINNQIAELEKMKNQISSNPIPQPTNLTQNFQLAPTNQTAMKYANSKEDVKKELIIADTPYFSNDLSVVWVKNIKGDIKTYEMKEIVEKDEKDLLIDSLQLQIKDLKEVIKNVQPISTNADESTESEESTSFPNNKPSKSKSRQPFRVF